jgi:hypothetical protein
MKFNENLQQLLSLLPINNGSTVCAECVYYFMNNSLQK